MCRLRRIKKGQKEAMVQEAIEVAKQRNQELKQRSNWRVEAIQEVRKININAISLGRDKISSLRFGF